MKKSLTEAEKKKDLKNKRLMCFKCENLSFEKLTNKREKKMNDFVEQALQELSKTQREAIRAGMECLAARIQGKIDQLIKYKTTIPE